MESDPLKNAPPDDAQLEAWLRANSAATPLPDRGFSHRVLAALPPPRRRFSPRLLACLIGAAAGLAVAAWPVLPRWELIDRLPAVDAALVASLSPVGSPAAGLAVAATVGSLLFVFWHDLRRFIRL